jgi:hypothetical protein
MPTHENLNGSAASTSTWGVDALSRTLDTAHANARRAFSVDSESCNPLVEIDSLYRHLIGNVDPLEERLSGVMLMRCHSHFQGGVSLAMSGMVAEAYVLLNSALKTAMQGVFVASQPDRQQLWINRSNDDASRRLMREGFKAKNVRRHLRQLDPKTATICDKLLRRTTDHADHPSAQQRPHQPAAGRSAARKDLEYFVEPGEVQHHCLRSAAQVGICCLSMFYYVYGDCYRSSGIPARLTKLRHGH